MNKFMKKTVVLCTAGIMGLTMLTACGSELDPDQIVATVGEDTVTLGTANFLPDFSRQVTRLIMPE